MKTAKVERMEITASKSGERWTVEVQLPAIVGYENGFRFQESAPTITEALEKLGAMLEGAECYFANDGDIDTVFREASGRSHHVEKSDVVDDILLIVPVENSIYFVVYYGGDSPVGWMDDTGIHVFDENALAYLEKSGAVIY